MEGALKVKMLLCLAASGHTSRDQQILSAPSPLEHPIMPDGEGRVFYTGLQKAGTTSFAGFMQLLGLRTVHGFGYGFYRNNQSCLDDLNGTVGPSAERGWAPDYDRVLHELGPARVAAMLVGADVQAAADVAWPLLFRFIAELFPKAKFVLWPRPAEKWVHSFTHFFNDSAPCRHTMLSYGAPSYWSLNQSDAGRERLGLVWE